MRVAICDDEEVQQQLLTNYLKEWAALNEVAIEIKPFQSGENFLFLWEDDKDYDLLIFDIEMGQLSGMELAVKIREQDKTIPILFVTGYDDYIAQGYEVAALHYLMKPLQKDKFFQVLDKLKKEGKQDLKLFFQTEKGLLAFPLSKIWYVEARAHQCILYTEAEEYTLSTSISEMAEYLSDHRDFVRCHRSYLVNLQHISVIVKSELTLDDGRKLPVSRNAEKEVNQAFVRLFKG